ncbi:putative elongator complex protein 1 [Spiromyces aspiralis]|uniref:Elongator complex protein 1 n=1 Tax=Spiromyces aspiralis TaxID=68401 RepID=A0ACC1HID9_9FUNG|nr:putative elongator complex protein 1 [Spiromyces aspiralis]
MVTKDFDVLYEVDICTDDRGQEQPVTVGWGRKETQFHGKVGKAEARRDPNEKPSRLSEDDDGINRITWKGDAAYFAVSTCKDGRRQLQVYNRDGALLNVSERIECLEHSAAWKPSGRVIASTEKLAHKHDVVFFERNGLRLHEFALASNIVKVHGLAWNADSTVLAVVNVKTFDDGQEELCIDLWSDKNYHWYLKQELRGSALGNCEPLRAVYWDPEQSLTIYLLTDSAVTCLRLNSEPCVATLSSPDSNSTANVIDNAAILSTPFRFANVPPPMSQYTLPTTMPVRHVVMAGFDCGNDFAAVGSDGQTIWLWTAQPARCVAEARPPILVTTISLGNVETDDPVLRRASIRQLAWVSGRRIVALASAGDGSGSTRDLLLEISLESHSEGPAHAVANARVINALTEFDKDAYCNYPLARLAHCQNAGSTIVENTQGQLFEVCGWLGSGDLHIAKLGSDLASFCPIFDAVSLPSADSDGNGSERFAVVGLSFRQQLCVYDHIIATGCSSFSLRPDYLMFTTSQHTLRFVPVDQQFLAARLPEQATSKFDESLRRLERGSTIVLSLPTLDRVVLQMPRGNLETIRPRALTLTSIRSWIDAGDYRSAFMACRVNRVDMNILYDYAPESFIEHVKDFVDQVDNVDYLNLFVSDLKDVDVTKTLYLTQSAAAVDGNADDQTYEAAGKTNRICAKVREALDAKDAKRYTPVIFTTYVRQHPPDIESALSRMVPMTVQERESALTYLLFLVDVNRVYDAALGLYDLTLALWVAQKSQRDPREYLAYLSELKALEPEAYRRFRIDKDLGRNERALANLVECHKGSTEGGEQRQKYWDELVVFVQAHELHTQALERLDGCPSEYATMSCLNGQRMEARKWYADAGAAYLLGNDIRSAVEAFRLAGMWRQALTLATRHRSKFGSQTVLDLADSVASILHDRRQFLEAAQVLLDYTPDHERAVDYLIEGWHWQEALRVIYHRGRDDLIETTLIPGLQEAYSNMLADFEEATTALNEKLRRLKELRAKPALMSAMDLFTAPDENLDNVDVKSDTTSMASVFTTFTGTTTAANSHLTGGTRRTVRTTKNSRREKRKKIRGKKGTIYEESYLIDSIRRMIKKISGQTKDVKEAALVLIEFQLNREARRLQQEFGRLVDLVDDNINWVFDEARDIPLVEIDAQEYGADETGGGVEMQPKHQKPPRLEKLWNWDKSNMAPSSDNGSGDSGDGSERPNLQGIFAEYERLFEHAMRHTLSQFEQLFGSIAQPSWTAVGWLLDKGETSNTPRASVVKPPESSEIFNDLDRGTMAADAPRRFEPFEDILRAFGLVGRDGITVAGGELPGNMTIIDSQHHDINKQIDHINPVYGAGTPVDPISAHDLRKYILKPRDSLGPTLAGKADPKAGWPVASTGDVALSDPLMGRVDLVKTRLPNSIFDEGVISSMHKPLTGMIDQMWNELVVDKIDYALDELGHLIIGHRSDGDDSGGFGMSSVKITSVERDGITKTKIVETLPDGRTRVTEKEYSANTQGPYPRSTPSMDGINGWPTNIPSTEDRTTRNVLPDGNIEIVKTIILDNGTRVTTTTRGPPGLPDIPPTKGLGDTAGGNTDQLTGQQGLLSRIKRFIGL